MMTNSLYKNKYRENTAILSKIGSSFYMIKTISKFRLVCFVIAY
jgi:hypothetical protein